MNPFTLVILVGIIALPVATIPLVDAQQGEVTINPIDDTYVDFSNQNSNYGGQTSLTIFKYNVSSLAGERKIWLKFDLSSIPDGAIVDTAILRLYCNGTDETFNIYAHSSSDISWTELALTWSNMPSYNATSMDTEQVATPSRRYNWSVIYAVQEAVDGIHGGPGIATIVLQETSFGSTFSLASFFSKEAESNPPELTVHWSEVIPEFQSFLILPILMIATLLALLICRKRVKASSVQCHDL